MFVSHLLRFLCLGIMLVSTSTTAAEQTMIGTIQHTAEDHIVFEHKKFPLKPLLNGVDMRKALGGKSSQYSLDVTVLDPQGRPMNYSTLFNVGYVTKAQVHLNDDGHVSQIQVLEMQQ